MRRIVYALLLLSCLLATAQRSMAACDEDLSSVGQRQALTRVGLSGAGIITLWGVSQWDYFDRSPHGHSEGWFGEDTNSGGADKLGHVYMSYVTADGLAALYRHWCFDDSSAARWGALSSFLLLSYMEVGDAFSDYGFSYEDFVANALGSASSYFLARHPQFDRKIDFRWEYGLHANGSDIFTDYDNSKYLLAIKLNGFRAFEQSALKHFELHLGYYSRGYDDRNSSRERNLYFGIGINLTDLFRRHGYSKTATFLQYYQPPELYFSAEDDLNK